MRQPIEALALAIYERKYPGSTTLLQIANDQNETLDRIADAFDVVKILQGQHSYIPASGFYTTLPVAHCPVC